MRDVDLVEFQQAVHKATRARLREPLSSGALDADAHTADDYAAANLAATWVQLSAGMTDPTGAPLSEDEAMAYLHASVHNRARDAARRRARLAQRERPVSMTDEATGMQVEPADKRSDAERLEAAQLVELLRRKLPPSTFDLLQRVADAGHAAQAYDPAMGIKIRCFYKRVDRAKALARRIVEGDMRC